MESDDHKLFTGWASKVLAVAITVAATSATSPASAGAATPDSAHKTCAIPQRAASLAQQPPIQYPEIAREGNAGGTSVIRVDLDSEGHVAQTAVVQSSGNTWLDREATRVSRESRYATGRANCEDVATSLLYEVVFDPS